MYVRFNGIGEFFLNVVWLNLQILFFFVVEGETIVTEALLSRREEKNEKMAFSSLVLYSFIKCLIVVGIRPQVQSF